MRIGVSGSGKYKNKQFLFKKLEEVINKDRDIIISGHSPRNKYDNIDIWAERWGNDNCKNKPIIHPPKRFTDEYFFKRNKLVSDDSDILLSFINKGQYKSGTWNTVKYFLNKQNFRFKDLMIYDEFGNPWYFEDLPNWIKSKIKVNKCLYSKSGVVIALGFERKVYGERGTYYEISSKDILKEKLHIPEDKKWKLNSSNVWYIEYRTIMDNIKVYYQKKMVDYADYKVGMFYIKEGDVSPFKQKKLF